MKALLIALALVGVGTVAQAGDTISFPHIGSVSIASLCDTGKGTFQTIGKVQVCDLKQVGSASIHGDMTTTNEFVNTNCRMEVVTISKKHNASEVVGDWAQGEASTAPTLRTVTATYPRTWSVEVQNNYGEASTSRWVNYTIPMCK